jgi:acetyltransferase/esterase
MSQRIAIRSGYAEVAAASLYYEWRGDGPAVIFIPGGLMDSTHFSALAEMLADEYTTVTYDRRGNGNSPRPVGWTSTTMGEQAEDVAGLIETLGLGPCVVWGGSLGGLVLLELASRRPGLIRRAIVHEPPLFSVIENGDKAIDQLGKDASAAVRDGGAVAAAEAHAKAVLGESYERFTPDQQARMAANADVFLGIEVPGLIRSLPERDVLTRVLDRVDFPVDCLAAPENRDSLPYRATRWLADHVGVKVAEIPGGHVPYATEPAHTAEALRKLLAA